MYWSLDQWRRSIGLGGCSGGGVILCSSGPDPVEFLRERDRIKREHADEQRRQQEVKENRNKMCSALICIGRMYVHQELKCKVKEVEAETIPNERARVDDVLQQQQQEEQEVILTCALMCIYNILGSDADEMGSANSVTIPVERSESSTTIIVETASNESLVGTSTSVIEKSSGK